MRKIKEENDKKMLFNSYIFVFAFLPITVLLWYGLNAIGWPRVAQMALVILSLVFYGYERPVYILLIMGSVLGNWCISRGIAACDAGNVICEAAEGAHGRSVNDAGDEIGGRRFPNRYRIGTMLGVLGICFNIGLLFYFKYYDFFFRNVNRVLGTDIALKNIALPLGISFFTFQQISFMADRMMRRAPHYAMLDYLNFVTFFPQLVAGPIVNHRELVPQFQTIGAAECRGGLMKPEWIEKGCCLFIIGLAKKVLLADKLGVIVDYGYGDVTGLDALSAFVVMLSYTFQIYFDFSGYSDMAVGLGWILGIRLPRNFNSPYKAASVKEFWNRWHMTLNAFFTQYVYIPPGGSRAGLVKKLRNTMIVFMISGIWHGAAWSFVLWGAAHGVMLCLENISVVDKIPRKLRWLFTFLFVNLAWVLFRSGSVSGALLFYRQLFSFTYNGKVWELAGMMRASWNYPLQMMTQNWFGPGVMPEMKLFLLLLVLLLLLASALCCGRNALEWIEKENVKTWQLWGLALLFALCVLSFSGVSTFLYFNF